LTPISVLASDINLKSDNLLIFKLSEHTYQHISYLQTESWGKVACNGMIVIENDKALILDTPSDNISSKELIEYLINNGISIIGIVPTHFHEDCLGGLSEFKKAEIPIYISNRTKAILEKEGGFVDYEFLTFDNSLTLNIDETSLDLEYFGAGHTIDNVVAFYEKDESIFGGCLVKELNASKGNLADANTEEWSNTVRKLKAKHPNAKVVIPGHGKSGGIDLFNYTIDLFEGEEK
ncbi:MAG: subclass B1 metallo-beta-lactamase, partial [Candidatus Kapaibacterium sp.]